MSESVKTALKLFLLVLLGSMLGFSPTVISVTQNAQKVQVAFAAGDYQEGASYLIEIAEAQPWWTSLWEKAGEAAFLAGDYSLAVSAYEKALKLGDLSESGQINLGSSYLAIGRPESAEMTWQSLPDSSPALAHLAALYEDQGEIARAVEVWYDYLAQSPDGGEPGQVFYFGLLIASDAPPKSLAYLDQSRSSFPAAGEVADAIRDAIHDEPAYQLVTAGQALAANGYWHLAAHAFEKATLLRPDYPEAWLYWGEALQHLENPSADSLEILQMGFGLDENSPLANLFLGLYWQRKGSHQTALEYFQAAEAGWPERADVLTEEGKSLAALGELEAAFEKYQAAVNLYPEEALYYRLLAEFTISYSYQVKEIGLPAARLSAQLNELDPANQDVLGQVLLALEDEMNAVKLFLKALELDPAYAPAYYHLGIVYSAQDDRTRAQYYLQQAVIHSDNPALTDQAERLLSSY